jgi:hypothetical protein
MKNRLELIREWEKHCEEAGHKIEETKYDMNLGGTYIECCAKKCTWSKEVAQ